MQQWRHANISVSGTTWNNRNVVTVRISSRTVQDCLFMRGAFLVSIEEYIDHIAKRYEDVFAGFSFPMRFFLTIFGMGDECFFKGASSDFPSIPHREPDRRERHSMVLLVGTRKDAERTWFFLFQTSYKQTQFFEANYDWLVKTNGRRLFDFAIEKSGNRPPPTCFMPVITALTIGNLPQPWTTRLRDWIRQQALPLLREGGAQIYNNAWSVEHNCKET